MPTGDGGEWGAFNLRQRNLLRIDAIPASFGSSPTYASKPLEPTDGQCPPIYLLQCYVLTIKDKQKTATLQIPVVKYCELDLGSYTNMPLVGHNQVTNVTRIGFTPVSMESAEETVPATTWHPRPQYPVLTLAANPEIVRTFVEKCVVPFASSRGSTPKGWQQVSHFL